MFGKVAGAERDRDEKRKTQRAGFGFGIFWLLFFLGGVVIFAFSVVGGWWWWPCGVQFQGYFCLVRCGCWYPRGEDHEDGIWLVFGVLCPVQSLSAVELFEPVGFLSLDSLSCLR